MKIKNIVLFLLMLNVLFSCVRKDKQLEKYLHDINHRKITIVDTNGWHIEHSYKDNYYALYSISKNNMDTMIDFSFKYYFDRDTFIIEDYYKLYPSKNGEYFYSLRLKEDTLYLYKLDSLFAIEKEFVVGKYYYLYKYNHMSENQKRYFEAHKDSLLKIRGDSLPLLPEIF